MFDGIITTKIKSKITETVIAWYSRIANVLFWFHPITEKTTKNLKEKKNISLKCTQQDPKFYKKVSIKLLMERELGSKSCSQKENKCTRKTLEFLVEFGLVFTIFRSLFIYFLFVIVNKSSVLVKKSHKPTRVII